MTHPELVALIADILERLNQVPDWGTQLDATDRQVTITITRQENDQ